MNNVFEMVTRDFKDIHMDIAKKLRAGKSYMGLQERLNEFYSKNKNIHLEADEIISGIEADCMEEGYNQGFADAVKMFMTCLK